MLRRSSLALALFLAACSSSDDTTTSPPTGTAPDGLVGDVRESVTWEDGTKLAGQIRIVEGVTVTIAPGAKIQCNEATQIILGGTLKVNAKDNVAKISCLKWTGVTVGANGKLDIDGLEIENATNGFQLTKQTGECTIKNSKILTSIRPFEVGEGSTLTLDHVTASVPATASGTANKSFVEIYGTLIAKHLTYEAQTNEGIMVHTNATADISDSEMTGHGAQDLISSYGAKSVTVSYTSMKGAHCGIHMQEADTFIVDHVTSTENLFGVTIYGAKTAKVTNSNLSGAVAWLDLQGGINGGPSGVTLENNFVALQAGASTAPAAIVKDADAPAPDTRATAVIAEAVPRP